MENIHILLKLYYQLQIQTKSCAIRDNRWLLIKYNKDHDLPTPQRDLHTPCKMFYGCISIASFFSYPSLLFFCRKNCINSIQLTYLGNKVYIKYKKLFESSYLLQNLSSSVKSQIQPNGLVR